MMLAIDYIASPLVVDNALSLRRFIKSFFKSKGDML